MIRVIYGQKGSGKTKKIIEMANKSIENRKGDCIFLSTTSRYRAEIRPQIKFIDLKDAGVTGRDMFFGFIKGMLSANYDLEYIFVDGAYRVMQVSPNGAESEELTRLLERYDSADRHFFLTVSCDRDALPESMAKYAA